jgi:hypothetical protein
MEYLHDGMLHDSLRAHFQTVDIVRLNQVLVEAGVSDIELRRRILNSYFFNAGQFLDNGWFEAEGRKFAPSVSFEELGRDSKRSGRIHLADPKLGTMFHEFAGGTVEMLFDPESAETLNVPVGEIGP